MRPKLPLLLHLGTLFQVCISLPSPSLLILCADHQRHLNFVPNTFLKANSHIKTGGLFNQPSKHILTPNNPPTSPRVFLLLLLEFSSPLQVVSSTGTWDCKCVILTETESRLGQLQVLLVGVPAAHPGPFESPTSPRMSL